MYTELKPVIFIHTDGGSDFKVQYKRVQRIVYHLFQKVPI